MNEIKPNGDGWVICVGICLVLCAADTMFPIMDVIGAGAGAARYA